MASAGLAAPATSHSSCALHAPDAARKNCPSQLFSAFIAIDSRLPLLRTGRHHGRPKVFQFFRSEGNPGYLLRTAETSIPHVFPVQHTPPPSRPGFPALPSEADSAREALWVSKTAAWVPGGRPPPPEL